MHRRARAAIGAACAGCAGIVVLLVVSLLTGVALGAALPTEPSTALRIRLPLWLAAAALGGGLQVVGPGAGRVSMLNDGGLIGPPQGLSAVGSERFRLDVIPLPLTLVTMLAIGLVLRRMIPADRVTVRVIAGSALIVAAVLAAAGLVLAFAADYAAVDAGVHPGRVVTPVGAATVGIAATLAAHVPRLPAVRRGPFGPALRAAGVVGSAVALLGMLAAALVGAFGRLGIVDTLVSNHHASGAAKALLGALLGPAAGFDAVLVGAGAPLHIAGHAFGFAEARTWLLPEAVDRRPLSIFLPLGTALVVIIGGVVVHLARHSGAALARSVAAYAVVFTGAAALAQLACHIDFRRVYRGAVSESATIATAWPMTLVVAALAGILVALIGRASTAS
ncbi:MAG: hypothetical protein ACR2F6_18420 [Mycobacteriales bacterium]